MKPINHFQALDDTLKYFDDRGAFLTVKSRSNEVNVMTIGWALFGVIWREPTLMVAVRPSRYTFKLIENADDFTVTVPFAGMNKQLAFCGSHSGSDTDKFKECDLVALPSQKVHSPIIKAKAARYYECKIVQATAMDKDRLDSVYNQNQYLDHSYHTYYFGKIVACYEE